MLIAVVTPVAHEQLPLKRQTTISRLTEIRETEPLRILYTPTLQLMASLSQKTPDAITNKREETNNTKNNDNEGSRLLVEDRSVATRLCSRDSYAMTPSPSRLTTDVTSRKLR